MRFKFEVSYETIKRGFDVTSAIAGLVVTAPLQLLTALAVRTVLGKPVLFKQERPGKDEELFQLVKFRTMLPIDPEAGHVTNEERTTKLGQLLRATSVDELPSLLNVLSGDMSLVGPRPLRKSYIPRFSRHHRRRHEVRPGLTGLAQVAGRNSLGWNERLDLDIEYVDSKSLSLDFRILYKTVGAVLKREGIREEGTASMSEFLGSGPNIVCRPLLRSDLPTRVEWLNNETIRSGISIEFVADLSSTQSWFDRTRDANRKDFIFVLEDGYPVAMAGFVDIERDSAYLYIYVNPNEIGKGYGRLVLVQLLKQAELSAIEQLKLEVKASNISAINLYKRFRFVKTGEISDATKYVMVRQVRETD